MDLNTSIDKIKGIGEKKAGLFNKLGIFTWALGPWRRSYLRRIDRLMSPLERERELAADRSIAQIFGNDLLRETLVSIDLRDSAADVSEILMPLALAGPPHSDNPAEAIRAAMRRAIPEAEAHRRIERALRSIIPPMEAHPPLAVRTGTKDVEDLLPFATVPQDALESVFGAADALDATVNAFLLPILTAGAEGIRADRAKNEARLAALLDVDETPDAILERAGILINLDRKDEVRALLRAGRAAFPDNVAIEAAEICELLPEAASAEEGAPLADRLEHLIEIEPMMRLWGEEPLFRHYLEIGSADRIKNLLDLRQHGEKALLRRLNAKLRPTDNLRAAPLSDYARANIAEVFAGHSVREVYPVLRVYEGTGTSSSFLVVRWRFLADDASHLSVLSEAFDDWAVISGTRALFRRFAELGIEPIPVPKKACRKS